MSQISQDTQRTIENIYGDFQDFIEDGDLVNAHACIDNMKDFSEEYAVIMKNQLV